MKYFILLLAAVLLAQAEGEWKVKTVDEFNDMRRDCHKEIPFSEELQKKEEVLRFPDEEVVRKYLLCIAKTWEVFDEENGFNMDRLIVEFELLLNRDEVLPIANRCVDKNEQGSSADVWVYRVQQCVGKTKLGPLFLEALGKLSK